MIVTSSEGAQSLAKAMDLVDLVTSHPQGVVVRDLHRLTGHPVSSIYRFVSVLEMRGLVLRAHGRVFPGPALSTFFATLGASIAQGSQGILGRLSAELDSTTILGISGGSYGYCLVRDQSISGLFQSVPQGGRFPLTIGAMGKALLAFSTHTVQEHAITSTLHLRNASGNSLRRPALYRELNSVRKIGYWFSQGEVQVHTAGVFSPLMAGKRAIGVIGAVTTEQDPMARNQSKMSGAVLSASRLVSSQIRTMCLERNDVK